MMILPCLMQDDFSYRDFTYNSYHDQPFVTNSFMHVMQ